MENERVIKGTVQRILAKWRRRVAENPDDPGRMFIEHDPGDEYDPNETPEERRQRGPDA